jgi:hypothetical protein
MSIYIGAMVHSAPLAMGLVALPLAVFLLGALHAVRRERMTFIWLAFLGAVFAFTIVALVASRPYAMGTPVAPLPVQVVASGLLGAAILAPALLAFQLLRARDLVLRAVITSGVGLGVAVLAAPLALITLGCLLTGDCL